MLTRICLYCGKQYSEGSTCICNHNRHKEYDTYRRNTIGKVVYHSKLWKPIRMQVKQRAAGLDEYAKVIEHHIVKGTIAHHIIPVEENPQRAFDVHNLIYVSARTHAAIHAAYNKSVQDKVKMQKVLLAIAGGVQKSF
ncbi:hypothetical protein [Megasphaera sueciensis]|uniref:hypothetical protein n=1 Tax=Megasphaera sueciensis TaxID=349094 RepID=UPI003CFD26A5